MTRRNLLLLASFVPAVVAACGFFSSDDSESDESAGTSAATPDAPTTLTLLMPDASGSETNEMEEVLKEQTFAGRYMVTPVTLRPTGGQTYSEAVTALAAAGTSPDLVWMDQFALPTLAQQGGDAPALGVYATRYRLFYRQLLAAHSQQRRESRRAACFPSRGVGVYTPVQPGAFFPVEYASAGRRLELAGFSKHWLGRSMIPRPLPVSGGCCKRPSFRRSSQWRGRKGAPSSKTAIGT